MSKPDYELRQHISDLERRVEKLERHLKSRESKSEVPDIRAFVEDTDPSSHTERALAIGYYLDVVMRNESFTTEDIIKSYRECRVPRPANPSDIVAHVADRGWVVKDGKEEGRQRWRVSAEGEAKIRESTSNETP